ncbi:hypothetical protein AAG906_018397 [Vitis piasezkii]
MILRIMITTPIVQRLMRRIRDMSQSDEFDESEESDFTSASNDMVASPNNEQCMGPPSDDPEDGDHNPNAPEIDEQDFTATLDRRNFSDNEDGLDGQRRFGRKKKDTLTDAFIEVLVLQFQSIQACSQSELSYLGTSRIMLADEDSSGKNFAALGDGTPLSNQTCLIKETSKESSAGIESVGDVENFQCA